MKRPHKGPPLSGDCRQQRPRNNNEQGDGGEVDVFGGIVLTMM